MLTKRLCERIWAECDERVSADGGAAVPSDLMAELVRHMLAEERIILPAAQESELVEAVVAGPTGLGPLENLVHDSSVSEIMVNGCDEIFVERHGRIERVPSSFEDDDHVLHVIDRILAGAGRRVDSLRPMVDARLPDGSRVHVVIPPLAVDGPTLTIRRFLSVVRRLDLEELGAFPDVAHLEAIRALVNDHANVLVSGPTSSGKTTLVAAALSIAEPSERIVVIEDSAELPLRIFHKVRLEARPAVFEAAGEVTIRDLVRGALRMRPDRIVVGEVRGSEAFDMVQAMHTGHTGCWSTVHANTPIDALERVTTMAMYANVGVPHEVLRGTVARAFNTAIQLGRNASTGTRCVTGVDRVVASDSGWVLEAVSDEVERR